MLDYNISEHLNRAHRAYEREDFTEAEKVCFEILAILDAEPRDGDIGDRQTRRTLHYECLRLLSDTLRRSGKASTALEISRQRLNLAEQLDDPYAIADAQQNLATVYRQLSDYSKALEYLRVALSGFEEHGHDAEVIAVWSGLGAVHLARAEYDLALEFYSRALAAHQERGMMAEAAKSIGNIGLVYFQRSDYPHAIEQFERALSLHEEHNSPADCARVRGNIGRAYYHVSDYAKALEYYGTAQREYEQRGMTVDLANVTANIGAVYASLEDHDHALRYFRRALELFTQIGSKAKIAGIQGNIGFLYHSMTDYEQALECFRAALALHEELGNRASAARVLLGLGMVHHSLKEHDLALEYYTKSLHLHEELGIQSEVSYCIGRIGALYADVEYSGSDPHVAENYLQQAIQLATMVGSLQYLYEQHQVLSELYTREGRWEQSLNHYVQYHTIEKQVLSEHARQDAQRIENRRKIEEAERDRQIRLARFQEQEKILHNILPSAIAERMVSGETTIAESFENVCIFFSDIVGFTQLSSSISPEELVSTLNDIFSAMDTMARRWNIEKIKTIGDSYMAVCGIPTSSTEHQLNVAQFALDVLRYFQDYRTPSHQALQVRIGIHCGSVVAGIIGENKFAYDLWGDAVNIASRMESSSEPGRVHVSEDFVRACHRNRTTGDELHGHEELQSEYHFRFIDRGEIAVKGKGTMRTYYLE